ncbi:MAG: ribosomal protein S18-alanine N-acetyltransferase [Desulfarculus sp.]|nr:ribosomal protein S18-alanine N-acetyltransferase [Desulfarculus sp.]
MDGLFHNPAQEPRPPRGPRLLITQLKHQHLDQVMAIERACFSSPWERRIFEAEVVFPQALCLAALALPQGLLVGYLIMWLVVDEAQIQNIAVHPAYRGQGVGKALLRQGLLEARLRGGTWASLEVRPSNLAARRLYASLGFAEMGRRPAYYQPEGEDALLLNADLAWLDGPGGENP